MQNNRILLLIDQLGSGGAERQLIYLANSLSERGYEVKLIYFYNKEIFYKENISGKVKVEKCLKGKSALRRPYIIANIVKRWNPKAVIAYLDGTSMAACIAKAFCPFKLIVSERNTTQKLSLRERIKFNLYRLADYVVPNSFSQSEFIKIYTPWLNSKVHVITNMIDTDLFEPSASNNKPDIPTIITTARISEQKNVIKFLYSLKRLKDKGIKAKFNWFGVCIDTNYLSTVYATQKSLGLEDYITFYLGGTKNVLEAYQNSTHFVLPSIFEGFPNVLCEAMSCGLICAASNVCDNAKILQTPELLFDPNNESEMAEVMDRMLSYNLSEQQRISLKNRHNISNLCSKNTFTDSYISLIE